MIDLDPFVNKTVDFAYNGCRLSFNLSHALFSSFDIDTGTKFLLRELASEESILGASSILDAGCGVGIIGITFAVACPGARVVMRDRDLLACAFAERNCRRNGIPALRLNIGSAPPASVNERGSESSNEQLQPRVIVAPGLLGEDDPFGPYDVILSNLPAKAGAEILSGFLRKASERLLSPGGCLAFVIVNSLAPQVDTWIGAAGLGLVRKSAGPGHTVFILRKAGPERVTAAASLSRSQMNPIRASPSFAELALAAGFYIRVSGPRSIGRYTIEASGYRGLPEFDTNGYATDLGVEALERAASGSLVRDFLVIEPGIGLSALWACRSMGPERVHAQSRDYLSLIATGANLAASFPLTSYIPRTSIEDEALPDVSIDAALVFPDVTPRVDPVKSCWELLARTTKRGAAVVIVTDSQAASRFEKAKPVGFRRTDKKRKKGLASCSFMRE
ncbi:MAG: methyltransferase [Spirochaetes bacterium]|nr:methyltransferase [Spirochaetota bacterium]